MAGFVEETARAAWLVRCRLPEASDAIYETSDRDEIDALADALATEPPTGAFCMCAGTMILELDDVKVELHHGTSLRWEGSEGNVSVSSPDALMAWLSKHGMSFVREEYDASEQSSEEAFEATARAEARWRAAMPRSLLMFFGEMREPFGDIPESWSNALETEFPDHIERTRVLLRLYGSSVSWSEGDAWERVPRLLLEDTAASTIVAAVDETCAHGLLRLLADALPQNKQMRAVKQALTAEQRAMLVAAIDDIPAAARDDARDAL